MTSYAAAACWVAAGAVIGVPLAAVLLLVVIEAADGRLFHF